MITELHLFMTIFQREGHKMELIFHECNQKYELTVEGLDDTTVIMYFDKNGKFKNCSGDY